MPTMIERMANAISKRRADEVGGCYSDVEQCDDTQCKCREDAIIDACNVLEEMREPTDEMQIAGDKAPPVQRSQARCIWQAMVDAATSEDAS